MALTLRIAEPSDAEWIVAGNLAMARETEGKGLDADVVRAGVRSVFADSGKGRYWVAESGGRVVGQLMVTWEWSDWRNGTMWWIQSVYVEPEHRRRGVFSSLFRHVEALAREDRECCGLRLYVERDNVRAQATYRALGMIKPGYEVMELDARRNP